MRDRLLLCALGAVILLNVFPLSTPFGQRNYDTEVHLFFADHYSRSWFDPWETRWYGGMWVWSYPPLAHQLIALLGGPWGIEVGYKVLQALSLVGLPVSIWLLGVELIGRRYAGWAALLAVLVPGLYTQLYTWGQLPSLVAMDLGLTALAFLSRYLRSGRLTTLATWFALAGAAAAAHHHTVIFILPLLAGAVIVRRWALGDPRRAFVRAACAALALAGAGLVAIIPFWWWLLTYYQPQAELPHPSRDGVFRTPLEAELFFWGIYGVFLLLAPFGFAAVVRRVRLWPFLLTIALLATLGLGTLTPLPRLLFAFRDLWQWLVYERFAIWAAVLSTFTTSVVILELRRRGLNVALAAIGILLLVGVAREATISLNQQQLPAPLEPWEESEIVSFLETGDHADWNYVTLGLGEAGMARLTRLTSARTFDGVYYTARKRPELRASGVGSVDAAYAWRTGLEIIPHVLNDPARWNLKWVILARPDLQQQLHAAGWTLLIQLHPLGTRSSLQEGPEFFDQQSPETRTAFRAQYGDRAAVEWAAQHAAELGPIALFSRVSIWQAPETVNVPRLGPPSTPPPYPPVFALLWGTVPLALLGPGLVLAVLQLARSGPVRSGDLSLRS